MCTSIFLELPSSLFHLKSDSVLRCVLLNSVRWLEKKQSSVVFLKGGIVIILNKVRESGSYVSVVTNVAEANVWKIFYKCGNVTI